MAIVSSPDGIVLHLRDDKPGIAHPGCWSLFGGAADEGERPTHTIRRELREELGLHDIALRALWRVVDHDGDGRLLTIFEVGTPVRITQMTLSEGQALQAYDLNAALDLRLATFARRSLLAYAASAHDQGEVESYE